MHMIRTSQHTSQHTSQSSTPAATFSAPFTPEIHAPRGHAPPIHTHQRAAPPTLPIRRARGASVRPSTHAEPAGASGAVGPPPPETCALSDAGRDRVTPHAESPVALDERVHPYRAGGGVAGRPLGRPGVKRARRRALFRDRLAPRVQQCHRGAVVTGHGVTDCLRVTSALLPQRLRVTSRAIKWVYYSKMM